MQMPIMYELRGKKVLVVGGGFVAYRKVEKLVEFGADITCVSKDYRDKFDQYNGITRHIEILRYNELNTSYFEDKDMVIAATDNEFLNKSIYNYCKQNRILCMTVDKSNPSDFSFMATERKKGLTLAASTNGGSPVFAKEIITTFMDSIDDETFKRLEMMVAERKIIKKLVK
jgi:precorrin-2 dehydrogenase/sirohydrochlorin ferrochelatase